MEYLNVALFGFLLLLVVSEVVVVIQGYNSRKSVDLSRPGFFLLPAFMAIYVIHVFMLGDLAAWSTTVMLTGVLSFYSAITLSRLSLGGSRRRVRFGRRKCFPDHVYLNAVFSAGILFYVGAFLWKGVPILSDNVDVARVELISGSGFLIWPGSILLISSIWLSSAKALFRDSKPGYQEIPKVLASAAVLFATGWRGQLIQLVLVFIVLLAVFGKFRLRYAFYSVGFVLFVAVLGILRSILSGKQLYGGAVSTDIADAVGLMIAAGGYLLFRFQEHYLNFQRTVEFVDASGVFYGRGVLMDLSILMPGGSQGLDFFLRDRLLVVDWEGGGGMPPTLIGSLYFDFGILGVIVGMFSLGGLMALWRRYQERGGILAKVVYASSLVWLVKAVFGSIGQNFFTYNAVYAAGLFVVYFGYQALVREFPMAGGAGRMSRAK